MVYSYYLSALNHRPLLTKALTSGFIMSLGDQMCQRMQRSSDKRRTGTFFVYGLFVNGPVQHYVFTHFFPCFGCSVFATLSKLVVSQTIYAPFSFLLFYTIMPLLKGLNIEDSKVEV